MKVCPAVNQVRKYKIEILGQRGDIRGKNERRNHISDPYYRFVKGKSAMSTVRSLDEMR